MFKSPSVYSSGEVFFAPVCCGVDPVRLVFLPILHAHACRNHKGHGRHLARFVQGVLLLASAARRFCFGIDVARSTHRRPLTQDLRGVARTRVLIRDGDQSASGIAPLAVKDEMGL